MPARGRAALWHRRDCRRVRTPLRARPRIMTRRVLMISPHFPPDSSAASHRVRLLAPHLESAGWRPTVLTLTPDAYEGTLDPALEQTVPMSLDLVRCRAWSAAATRRFGVGDLGLRSFDALRRSAIALLERERYDVVY